MTANAKSRRLGRVLIAEGNPVSRRILETAFRRRGHVCEVAGNGQEALERYLAFRPDVLVVDWMMPGLSGRELCRRIRQSVHGSYCYVMVTAALGKYAPVLAAMQAGVDDYLNKPLDEGQLECRLLAARRIADLRARAAATDENTGGTHLAASRRDPVTRLGNRLGLQEHLAAVDARTRRYGCSYCIALCAFDQRSPYGEGGGNAPRDRVLRAAAEALRGECRGGDLAYRQGDEVVVVLPDRTLRAGGMVLERMRNAVEALAIPDAERGGTAVVTISAGVAAREPTPGESSRDVLARAGGGLHEARSRGGNRVVIPTEFAAPPQDAGRESVSERGRRFASLHDPYLDRVVGTLRETRRKDRGPRRFGQQPPIAGVPRGDGS